MCTKSALALLFGERRDTEPAGEVQESELCDTEPAGEVQESELCDTEPAGEVQEGKKCHRNACIQGGTFLLCVQKCVSTSDR